MAVAVAGLLPSADGFGAGPRRAFAGAAGLPPASAVGFLSALPLEISPPGCGAVSETGGLKRRPGGLGLRR